MGGLCACEALSYSLTHLAGSQLALHPGPRRSLTGHRNDWTLFDNTADGTATISGASVGLFPRPAAAVFAPPPAGHFLLTDALVGLSSRTLETVNAELNILAYAVDAAGGQPFGSPLLNTTSLLGPVGPLPVYFSLDLNLAIEAGQPFALVLSGPLRWHHADQKVARSPRLLAKDEHSWTEIGSAPAMRIRGTVLKDVQKQESSDRLHSRQALTCAS